MKLFNKLLVGVSLISVMSCTKGFEEMNVNPNQPAAATPGQLMATAQYNYATAIGDAWNNGRMGMYYAQYWSSTYYAEESYYQIRENVNLNMWTQFYANVLRELVEAQEIDREAKLVGFENRIAIAEIMKQLAFHTLTDIYGGPIPYTEAVTSGNVTPKYENGPEVYAGILNTLDEQIEVLKAGKPGTFSSGDIIYGGNVANWIKFANSLRLRVALRMVDAKPAEAAAAIAKSLDPANGGIISSNAESAMFRWISGAPNNNPLAEYHKTRIDFSVSEPFVDYLKKRNDPRLGVYAQPLVGTTGPGGEPVYVGEVYGRRASAASSNGDRTKVSLPNMYVIGETAPTYILTYSEVEFMLAEIAARGIAGLTNPVAHYEEGIRASFRQAGLTDAQAESYILSVPYLTANDWKNAIGSQKWIAMYGQGIQSWFERLRLDFVDPYTGEEIFKMPATPSVDPTVTDVPSRMSYPVVERDLNKENYAQALQWIGGQNVKGAKQWWDVN